MVPVKGFERGKSRLGELLDGEARAELARAMFDHVVGEVLVGLARRGEIAGALVVTDGDDVAARAMERGAEVLRARPVGPGRKLGAVVDEALAAVERRGGSAALVIMGDLPALAADDVRALLRALPGCDVVLAPDAAGTGTNALGMRLPAPMETCFCGGESLRDHEERARERGLLVVRCDRPGLSLDVDQPSDYARVRAAG